MLKDAVQKIIELAKKYGREVALSVCDDGLHITIGDPYSVRAKVCPIVLHTHFHSPELSLADIEEALQKNIPVLCAIHTDTQEMQCLVEGVELYEEKAVDQNYVYTLEKIIQHLILIEEHLKDYPCWEDCYLKHGLALKGYLSEILLFAPEGERKFWIEVKEEVEEAFKNIYVLKDNLGGAEKMRMIRKKIQEKIFGGLKEVVIDRWTWERDKPKIPSEREELYQKYGERCFLDPERRAFPICVKVGLPDEGKISCDGLRAAYIRARALITASRKVGRKDLEQYYTNILNKALDLAKKYGCRWVRMSEEEFELEGGIRPLISGGGHNSYVRKQILSLIPKHNFYIQPFFGTGSIFWEKEKVEREVINDIESNLYNYLVTLRDTPPEKLCEIIDSYDWSFNRDRVYELIYRYRNRDKLSFCEYLYLNKYSFCGDMESPKTEEGVSSITGRRWKTTFNVERYKRKIPEWHKRLKGVEILNKDFREIIKMFEDEKEALWFIDPPYDTEIWTGCKYIYGCELTPEDVFTPFKNVKGKMIFCYNDSEKGKKIANEIGFKIAKIITHPSQNIKYQPLQERPTVTHIIFTKNI